MKNNTTVISLRQPKSFDDPLTELARDGARRMLAKALAAEADAFVASFDADRLPDGRQRIVRHGLGLGSGVIFRPAGMPISGPLAFTFRRGWSPKPSVCWS